MAPAPKYSIEEQEARILEAAAACINKSSLLDFKMSDIAKEAELSMGSVYKFIQTKGDVLLALATNMMTHMQQQFKRVLSLPLSTPERMLAVHLVPPDSFYMYPFGVHLSMLLGNEEILSQASKSWIEKLASFDTDCMEVFTSMIQGAIESGELRMDAEDQEAFIEEMMIGHWSTYVGFVQVTFHRHSRHLVGMTYELPYPLEPSHPFVQGAIRQINSYTWKQPIKKDESLKNIYEELGALGVPTCSEDEVKK